MVIWLAEFVYEFENFFHPFVGELIEQLNKKSLPGMLDPSFLDGLATKVEDLPDSDAFFTYFGTFYSKPENGGLFTVEGSPKEIDLSVGGPYANYNWELFFHIPLTIAVHLSKNQRFAEAQRWFHYIFDPTCNDPAPDPRQRYWRFLRFRQTDVTQVDELLALLSKPDGECTHLERRDKEEILAGYKDIRDHPFRPHAVARTRHLAYQYCVVMKYLDNLIAWGDSLFRQDIVESINEATQLYVLAANLLGARPQRIPPRGTVQPKTFKSLKDRGLDPMGNALVELEGKFPFKLGLPHARDQDQEADGSLFGIGRTLYFCIPRNDKMLSYWDTVADRLFKIRHCMTIEGVVRQLALFDPPIDPGMLVKAAAVGIDIGSIVSGLNQPISPVRAPLLIQKTLELCAEVRNLGAALLTAIEKGDSEQLALLRQGHEIKIQQMQQEVRFLQWKQAQESTESLLRSRASALERYDYYLRLFDQTRDKEAVPDTFTPDRRELTEENFDETYERLVGNFERNIPDKDYSKLVPAPGEAANMISSVLETGNLYLNLYEFMDLNVLAPAAGLLRAVSAASDAVFAALAAIPDANIDVQYWGVGGHATVAGGSKLSDTGRAVSSSLDSLATVAEMAATYVSKTAKYQRRADEWILEHNLATCELAQIGRQLIGSLIAEQIAHHEYRTIRKQIEQSEEVERFLQEKFTTEELHAWMQGELSRLYYEYYRFAFDTARKAEQTMKRELMRPELDATDYVKFNYWDGGRKGLLAGEALYLDVKRLEMAYHEQNKRELELTRHVSLRQLDPLALLTLKATGTCQVTIPEWLYDLDCPGHYMRRIKSVALSIPAVVGPYTSVNCTLSLLNSTLRKSPILKDDEYRRQGAEDDRFVNYIGVVQSIVTSSGNSDSGLFETNLRDERFLPFEGAGAESTWKLDLPKDYPAFDHATISDVILHIRYTARQGVNPTKVIDALRVQFAEIPLQLALLFSLRHDFPTEWAAFVSGADADRPFTATIRRSYFPYFAQGKKINVEGLDLYDGQDVTNHRAVGDQTALAAWSDGLAGEPAQFILTAEEDVAPPRVLRREASAEVFLVIRYSLE